MSSSILKKLAIVLALLGGAWAYYLYQQIPHHVEPFAATVETAEKLLIQKGDTKVQLQKSAGQWKVSLGVSTLANADESQVKSVLSSLKSVQLDEVISDRADRAGELEVDDTLGVFVALQDAKGQAIAEGVIGKSAADGMHFYFRNPKQPQIYLAKGIYKGEVDKLEANAWRSRQIIDIAEEKIDGILITSKGVKLDYVRVSTNAWTLDGKPVSSDWVNALVGKLAHLRADEFVDPVKFPAFTYESLKHVVLSIRSGTAVTEVRVGKLDAAAHRYPISSGKEFGVAWLSQATVESLLRKRE